jgi:hypothetical protein
MHRFEVHTNFTGTAKKVHAFTLEELDRPETLAILEALFTDPERLRPGRRVEEVTEEAAREFASLVDLRGRGVDPRKAAHFLNKILFCLFAEDVGLLPKKLFQRLLEASHGEPDRFSHRLEELFEKMAHGGSFGLEEIAFFNGGLFADVEVVAMTAEEIRPDRARHLRDAVRAGTRS